MRFPQMRKARVGERIRSGPSWSASTPLLGQQRALVVWPACYRQVQAAEERLRQAEQDIPPAQTSPPEFAKLRTGQASREEVALPPTEVAEADGHQDQLRTVASDLLSWKGRLKVLRQAQLPKWRGCFQWQIEAKIDALQTEDATLRAEAAKPDG